MEFLKKDNKIEITRKENFSLEELQRIRQRLEKDKISIEENLTQINLEIAELDEILNFEN